MGRNVREDSVFKFVYDHQFIDHILEVFTPDKLFLFLKKYSYNFDVNNAEEGKSKGKHIATLKKYFSNIDGIEVFKNIPKEFDKQLTIGISKKIKEYGNN